ncbi:MAG: 4a-hydroxytetrahydrobiopterin dehydratase [Flavobacteriaceae bacterium]|nr:4a-hydroxytetrahydrobiopterin dehydratase [Flavobacteriaceae bacterium]
MAWKEENNKLVKEFEFKDFSEAFAFITRVALAAEKANHHPELYNVYKQVTIKLSTHDAGNKVTQKDQDLAQEIDEFYKK